MHLAGVVLLGLVASGWCSISDDEIQFKEGFKVYHESGVQTEEFQDVLDKYALSDEVRNSNWQVGNPQEPRIGICVLCNLAITTVLEAYDLGVPIDEIAVICVDLCISLNIQPPRICQGVVEINIATFAYILNNTDREHLTPKRLCAIAFQGDGCGEDDPALEWSVDLGVTEKPPVVDNTTETVDTVTIMHMTDIHFDLNYLIGGNVDCGEPMCCRIDQGVPEFPNVTAGRWGDYRGCDIPWNVVTDAVNQIKANHQVDYIYLTGDSVDHGVWDTSITKNNATLVRIHNLFAATFPGVPVFPAIGNHEPHPLNVFAPSKVTQEDVSTAWLYETLADLWSVWLPADTRETILRGGFYTVLVRPGFRVAVLNNQQCYGFNWFLFYDQQDPDGQLQWLVEVLLGAEANEEKVHLLYHVPPGKSDCYYRWSREFNRIVNRFENIITGQFAGHTHNDEYQLFYSHEEPDRANSVVFVGGSLTTYSNVNPNYRLYTVDAESWDVVDHETWIYNITDANLTPENNPNWFKMYSFKDAYGVPSLSPRDLDILVHEMAVNNDTMQQYYRFHNLYGDPKMSQECDAGCKNSLLCSIVTSDSSNSTHCEGIISERNAQDFLITNN